MLADGFEEIEALCPVDVLRRAGVTVKTVGIGSRVALGAHGIPVVCDATPDEVSADEVDMLILPGGMPGAENLDKSPFVDKMIREVSARGARLAAICAAPLCLGRRGLLDGKRATCYPGFENELRGAQLEDSAVVTDGSITTAKGMGAALEFALELVRLLVSRDEAVKIAAAVQNSGVNIADEPCKKTRSLDERFIAAVEVVIKEGKVSTSLIQRKLGIGYGKAAMYIDMMENLGIVGEANGQNPREVIMTEEEWQKKLESLT